MTDRRHPAGGDVGPCRTGPLEWPAFRQIIGEGGCSLFGAVVVTPKGGIWARRAVAAGGRGARGFRAELRSGPLGGREETNVSSPAVTGAGPGQREVGRRQKRMNKQSNKPELQRWRPIYEMAVTRSVTATNPHSEVIVFQPLQKGPATARRRRRWLAFCCCSPHVAKWMDRKEHGRATAEKYSTGQRAPRPKAPNGTAPIFGSPWGMICEHGQPGSSAARTGGVGLDLDTCSSLSPISTVQYVRPGHDADIHLYPAQCCYLRIQRGGKRPMGPQMFVRPLALSHSGGMQTC